jgi:hypothetical protein
MRLAFAALVSAPLVISSMGCWHATELAATWYDPHAGTANFHHAVAVFVSSDASVRRSVEDDLARNFPNTVPSYRVMEEIRTDDQDKIADALRGKGFDGAIIMRVVDVALQTTYVPGTYWYPQPYGFAGYWRTAWASPYDPGAFAVDRIVTVETQVYSLKEDKLLFAARSNTTNPSSATKLTESVMRHVRKRMEKDGLLVAQATTVTAPQTQQTGAR